MEKALIIIVLSLFLFNHICQAIRTPVIPEKMFAKSVDPKIAATAYAVTYRILSAIFALMAFVALVMYCN
jgi:hypothetical protein